MKEKKKDFIMLLEDLCYIYKDYIDKNTLGKISVYIDKSRIIVMLINNYKIIDEFGLAFNSRERDSYIYISIALMKMLFGNKIIYSKGMVFCDDMDIPSLEMKVNDIDILYRMVNAMSFYREMDFYDRIGGGKRTRNKINQMRNANNLGERVKLTRSLINKREKK